MENTTMTNGMVAMAGAVTRLRLECPQPATTRLLADVLGGSLGKARIQGEGFGPFAGYAPTNHTFMDVAHIRSGRPPV